MGEAVHWQDPMKRLWSGTTGQDCTGIVLKIKVNLKVQQ